ncbi:PREDICTED: interferon alpha-inducible protein 27-like protein 2 [Calidris pugnax]|nr:PREDICTED: interferon alpha-inducible protein 27-like protein 2 isoform X2 [Calidris pugnax]XP_014801886.1 PREDICTED: interferon alpha-inducible protein 27-like protein 2 [Calidris pugnax]
MEKNLKGAAIGAAVGAGVALVGIPVAIGALGFTATGITPGSVAAKMMSASAIANGGGVAKGSTVAVLQSIGAAGLSPATKIGLTTALGSLGAAVGAMLSRSDDSSDSSDDDDPKGGQSSGQPRARPGGKGQPRFQRRSREQRAAGWMGRNGRSVGCTPGVSPSLNFSQPGQQGDSPRLPSPRGAGAVCLAANGEIYYPAEHRESPSCRCPACTPARILYSKE